MLRKILSLLVIASLLPVNAQHVAFKPFRHYKDRLGEFELEAPIDSGTIVMLGDSMTEFGYDWNRRLGCDNIVNRGIAGDTADGVLCRLDNILAGAPRAIFLMVGINDLSHDLTAQEVATMVNRVVGRICVGSPETRLYVESCLPINEGFGRWKTLAGRSGDIPEINRLIREYCNGMDVEFINLYPHFLRHGTNQLRKELTRDGLHLSQAGYRIWCNELRPYIKQAMSR